MVTEFFLKNLEILMSEKGLKHSQLSQLLGKPVGAVNTWFRKANLPSDEAIEELAKFFNVETYYFFMKPGTQKGILTPTKRFDSFDTFLNEYAENNFSEGNLNAYRSDGGPDAYLSFLRENKETDMIHHPPWFIQMNEFVQSYVNVDLIAKVRNSLVNSSKSEVTKKG